MRFLFTLLTSLPFPALPTLTGWVAWLILCGLLLYYLFTLRRAGPKWKPGSWGLLVGLSILVPLTSLFLGLRLSSPGTLPFPGLPAEPPGSALMVFSAVPWTLAGGILGPLAAAALGALAGLLRGAWDTYNLFTLLELAFMGALFSVGVRQRYRTPLYGLLRQPLVAALVLVPGRALFYLIAAFFTLEAPATARLDFALSNAGLSTLAFAGEMLVAGLVAQAVSMMLPSIWGDKGPLQPSPAERSLETRFLWGTGVFLFLIILTLLVGDWQVAGQAARDMLRDRMSGTAQAAAQTVPFFLETGQNLAAQISSDPRLGTMADPDLSAYLGRQMQTVPYFDELFLVDAASLALIGGYPDGARSGFGLLPDEQDGLRLALNGVLMQVYSIPPSDPAGSARVSFLAAVQEAGGVRRVLIGRASLATNPLTQPLLDSLKSMDELNGAGILLDENRRVLYSSSGEQGIAVYDGLTGTAAGMQENAASDGTRQFVYYQPVPGRPWAIVLTIPARQVQQLALNIALPLSGMIFLLALVALVVLRLGLRVVTASLQNLSVEANRIAEGKLDHPLQVRGADEIGQLRRAFEQMRQSLQARLNELNRLLLVSQGVSSSLEMEDAVRPVLEAILATGASSARVVLDPAYPQDGLADLPGHFSLGANAARYAHLDEQVLARVKSREYIAISSLGLSREFPLNMSVPNPAALLAVPLRRENHYYGAVWAGYEQPRSFSESELRFAITLAGQAALALSNVYLFHNVEAGRRQLEAILNSTPDPVLVTDHRNRLVLANRAANNVLELGGERSTGQPTERVIAQRILFDLLQAASQKQQSAEVVLKDKRTYLATASTVSVEGRPVGRVCILRDVTYLKELDTMKSDFVATVSHDLRSPLTLMRGYTTMLPMVGWLNDQQQAYLKKIASGVENMTQLVNNLLDLGRIEVGVGLELESVPVLDILERVKGQLQPQAVQKDILLKLELPGDMPHAVQADAALLQQAIYNLAENAIKYTQKGGNVTIRVASAPDTLIFEVCDTGIGIPADDMPRLFEKFHRGSQREARAQHGTGLGLAIVHSIAERHGGRVWVESQPGKGSTFFLQIPLAQPKTVETSGLDDSGL